jgi:conjugative transfer signal peptidase TraF
MSRFAYVMISYLAVLFTVIIALIDPAPRLLWNASASAPIGLYAVHPTDDPHVGELVAILPPEPLARWMAARHYVPLGIPLLKHVAAKAGQQVCRHGVDILIDGKVAATAKLRDSHGRPMPQWRGCRRLQSGELFLLNRSVPDSLDSRYFGPLPAARMIGAAQPLFVREPVLDAKP